MTGGGTAANAGAIRFLRWHPWGLAIDSNAASNCYNPDVGAGCTTGSPTSRTTSNPQAGVWEVTVDAHRRSDAYPDAAPFTLTATILGASVTPNPDIIASATIGTPVSRELHADEPVRRVHRPGGGRAWGARDPDSDDREPRRCRSSDVTVPAGATSLRATIGSPSDPAADLDLFVYNCTTGHLRARRAERGRRLRGVGDDQQPGSGRVEGRRRRLRGPCGDHDVQVHRRVLHDVAARDDRGHGRERAPAGRFDLDGSGHGDGERRTGTGPRLCTATSRCGRTRTCSSAPVT